jgi:hypothetical protein
MCDTDYLQQHSMKQIPAYYQLIESTSQHETNVMPIAVLQLEET